MVDCRRGPDRLPVAVVAADPLAHGGALTAVVAVVGGVVLTLVAGASRTITAPDRYVTAQGDIYDVTIEQAFGVPRVPTWGRCVRVDVVDAATFVFGGLIPEGSEEPAFALGVRGVAGVPRGRSGRGPRSRSRAPPESSWLRRRSWRPRGRAWATPSR